MPSADRRASRAALALSAAIGAAALAQLVPTVSGIPPLVRRVAPAACGPRRPGHLTLTFDDGPHPRGTPAVLRILAHHGCTATFFVIGEQAAMYPDLVRQAHQEGHEIAVHGATHVATPFIPPRRMHRDLQDTADLVGDLTGRPPRWYRPPYGVASGTALVAARAVGLQPVWWTHWAREWDRSATANNVATRALAEPARVLTRGGTLLLHDSDSYGRPGSWRLVAHALPRIIEGWTHRGVTLGPVAP